MAGGPVALAAVKAPTGAVPRGHCVCRVLARIISRAGCVGLQSANEPLAKSSGSWSSDNGGVRLSPSMNPRPRQAQAGGPVL